MPEDKNQHCSNCYFFLQSSTNESGEIGYCRANPPAAVYEGTKTKIARFPVVIGVMWCGAWDSRDDATA